MFTYEIILQICRIILLYDISTEISMRKMRQPECKIQRDTHSQVHVRAGQHLSNSECEHFLKFCIPSNSLLREHSLSGSCRCPLSCPRSNLLPDSYILNFFLFQFKKLCLMLGQHGLSLKGNQFLNFISSYPMKAEYFGAVVSPT